MARLGRKLLLTEKTTEDLCAALGIGSTIEIACSFAGVSTGTYYGWMRKAEEALKLLAEDPEAELTPEQIKYLKFFNKIDKTQSYAAIGWLQVIERAATTDPNWARFMLKVRYPKGFSEVIRQEVDVTTKGQAIGALTDKERRTRVKALLEALAQRQQTEETPEDAPAVD